MTGYTLCEEDLGAELKACQSGIGQPATGWILQGPLNSMRGGENKILPRGYLVRVTLTSRAVATFLRQAGNP